MRPNFRPLRGFVVFLSLVLLTSFAHATDKKRKPAEPEVTAKAKAKPTQKVDPKQQAKTSRETDKKKKDEPNKQQLAQKKKNEATNARDRGKDVSKLAARQREEKTEGKKNAKTAKLEAEKKNDKTTNKLAQREPGKKAEKPEKKETVAKKQPPEKAAKVPSKPDVKTELAATKIKSDAKRTKQPALPEAIPEEQKPSKRNSPADHSKSLAKLESKIKSEPQIESRYPAKEEKVKELPSVKFMLRPIAKISPRVDLKFSLARAVASNSFDAPPPQDNGPDVIDVIEHDSTEARRLDDVLKSEMKTLQFTGVPGNSRKKMDVGKMDAERIKQIQESLAKKGYYLGEISGQYNDETIEAMRKFQETHKIDVTGYATAQSLRLLGLTDW